MQAQNNCRYERKFSMVGMEQSRVRSLILHHPAMFYEPYPPRYVNNIYFDTPGMDHYDDNISGSANRGKVRLRWYHDLCGVVDDAVLEFKNKRGWVGWKENYRFPSFSFDTELTQRKLINLIEGSDLPAPIIERMHMYQFALVNRYYREYYATRDERFRVTLDRDLKYYRVRRLSNSLSACAVDHHIVVVELKYDVKHELEAQRIASMFPFRITRSSKYVRGIEHFL
jgi:hypothetical protein